MKLSATILAALVVASSEAFTVPRAQSVVRTQRLFMSSEEEPATAAAVSEESGEETSLEAVEMLGRGAAKVRQRLVTNVSRRLVDKSDLCDVV